MHLSSRQFFGRTMGMTSAACALLCGIAFASPCKEEVIIGQRIDEVSANCVMPTLKDHRELWVEEKSAAGSTRSTTAVDEWTFDTGEQQLMRTLVFRDGSLAEIKSDGYGRVRDALLDNCRNGEVLAVGDTMLDAYVKCGEPLAREKRADKVTETIEEDRVVRSGVPVVEWTYRYGPTLPGYTIRFENGRATEIWTREFGK